MHGQRTALILQQGLVKLSILFFISFCIPGALLYGGMKLLTVSGFDSGVSPEAEDANNKRAFLVKSAGDFIRVSDAAGIEPAGDKDFLLTIAVKFLSLPPSGEKTFVLQKYDKDAEHRQGMALAFTGDADGIHPLVYWRNTEGFGRWFRFSALQVAEKEWFALSLSFLRGELLGLHLTTSRGGSQAVSSLGGYRFDSPVYPESDSDLFLGGNKAGNLLDGRLGGFFVFHETGLDRDLPQILSLVQLDANSGAAQSLG